MHNSCLVCAKKDVWKIFIAQRTVCLVKMVPGTVISGMREDERND